MDRDTYYELKKRLDRLALEARNDRELYCLRKASEFLSDAYEYSQLE